MLHRSISLTEVKAYDKQLSSSVTNTEDDING
jgi:hypothetical protein